ncbi:MAG: ribonuclease HI [Actinomycetota bacterium]
MPAGADEVEIWTDGACSGNPGPGGWGAILRWRGHESEVSGGDPQTTNNRMELSAVIGGLGALTRPSRVVIVTDASYVEKAFTAGWLDTWQRNGWKTAAKKPVENQDLWQELLRAVAGHEVRFERVKGHAGIELNERADQLAVAARDAAHGT